MSSLAPSFSKILQSLIFLVLLCNGQSHVCAQQPAPSSPTADRFLNILTALGKKEYPRAVADSESLIRDDPAFPLTYEKLVQAAQRGGQLDQAQIFFNSQLATNNPRIQFGLGLIHRERGEVAAAIEQYRQCLQQLPDFVPAYIALVNAYSALDRLPEVEPFIVSLPHTASSRYALSYLRYTQRLYPEAIELSEQALLIDPHLSEAYKTKAQSLYAWGRNAEARQAAQALLQKVTEPEKIELRLSGMQIAGLAAGVLGNRADGIAELNSAYRGAVAVGNLEMEERIHSQLGYLYELQKDCMQSLQHAKAALAVGSEIKSRYVGRYVGNLGGAYACLGDMTEAVNYYNQALKISTEIDPSNLVSLLTNIAEANVSNYTEALPLLERALAVSQSITNPTMELRVRLGLGALYQQNGASVKALEQTTAALQLARQTGVAVQEGNSWNQLGTIHFSMLAIDPAMNAHQQALTIGERTNTPQLIWQALAGLAAIDEKLGKPEQAIRHYRQAIDTIEDVRRRIGISEDRASFFADKVNIYEKLIGLLIASKPNGKQSAAEAFHYVERARARAFLDLLAEARVEVEQNAAPELAKRQQELQQRISQLTTQLLKERSQETNKQDKTKIAELEKGLSQADIELADWLRDLRRRNPHYAALKYPEPITLETAQKMLDDQTILLSYSLAEPQSFLFALTRNEFQVKLLPPEATLRESVNKLLAAITDKNNPAPAEYRRGATRLSQELLQPVSSMFAGKNKLVIVADGALHRLPFEALLLPGMPARGDLRKLPYLITRFAVNYAPSASVWAELLNERRTEAPKGFIAFGDPVYERQTESVIGPALRAGGAARVNLQPLPYSREEINGIAKLFADDDRAVFFAEEASEENVKAPQRLTSYRMIHFSTHGYVNEARPHFSGLLLSSPRTSSHPEDGLLSAYEIFNLKLQADLVVLSACETGLGKEVKGEGLMSLMRAFMYAGTPSVVVSLWNVNDETAADLMIRFYRNLKSGMSKSEALRQAQLQTIGDNGFPFFWAPFVLVGIN
jgi:CHAT domain-containing protein/lipopolysaccharide biosynthesis regulator YciM